MIIQKTAKNKIINLLDMGLTYCEKIEANYAENHDVLFLVSAFSDKFYKLKSKFHICVEFSEVDITDLHEFESTLFVWTEGLTHNMAGESLDSNSLYEVLYSVLHGIEYIIEEDQSFVDDVEPIEHIEQVER